MTLLQRYMFTGTYQLLKIKKTVKIKNKMANRVDPNETTGSTLFSYESVTCKYAGLK